MSSQYINLLMHFIDSSELEKSVGVPMSHKCGGHMDMVLASQTSLKPSKASGLVQV